MLLWFFYIYILLNNSVSSENDSSFQVKVLIHGCSAALQKAQRLSHLCLPCSKWQIFRKEARIEINGLQLMIRCYLSPDSKKSVAGGGVTTHLFAFSYIYSPFRQFLHLSVGSDWTWTPLIGAVISNSGFGLEEFSATHQQMDHLHACNWSVPCIVPYSQCYCSVSSKSVEHSFINLKDIH